MTKRHKHHATFIVACLILTLIVYGFGHLGGTHDARYDIENSLAAVGLFWVAVLFIRLSHRKMNP